MEKKNQYNFFSGYYKSDLSNRQKCNCLKIMPVPSIRHVTFGCLLQSAGPLLDLFGNQVPNGLNRKSIPEENGSIVTLTADCDSSFLDFFKRIFQ